jgi:WhiB family transcriptional regulator, redox-sensing transcriptional regulator
MASHNQVVSEGSWVNGASAGTGDRRSARMPDADVPEAWMLDGACRHVDPAMFFPSDGAGVERAKRVCATCDVASACLEYALRERIDHGVWGGASERERRRILRRRRQDVTA